MQQLIAPHGIANINHSLLPGLQVHEATIKAGAYPSPLNYWNFPKSVCTSVNEVRQVLRS